VHCAHDLRFIEVVEQLADLLWFHGHSYKNCELKGAIQQDLTEFEHGRSSGVESRIDRRRTKRVGLEDYGEM
jgi:hypothetical protein